MKNILSIHCAVCFEFRPPINIHTFNIYDNYHPVHLHKLHTTTIICFSIKFKFITTRKRSLGQGNIFTGVCLSTGGVPAPGGCLLPGGCLVQEGGVWSWRGCLLLEGGCSGGCLLLGGCLVWGVPGGDPPRTATAAGGTHPTGMHSCNKLDFVLVMQPFESHTPPSFLMETRSNDTV